MGRDKALLELAGVPMLARTARLVEPLVERVTVVGSPARYGNFGVRVIPDALEGLGPLGGISTALGNSSSEWNLLLACDLPYLTTGWLSFLIHRAEGSEADAVLPQTARGPEPLCAMYRARRGPAIAAELERGVRKITEALAVLKVEYIASEEWKAFDSAGRLFKNMNAPADYEEARASFENGQR
jgi:molybdopterin-guanine dinucleotide biosynthesis protein A